jgi:hypothetical protein
MSTEDQALCETLVLCNSITLKLPLCFTAYLGIAVVLQVLWVRGTNSSCCNVLEVEEEPDQYSNIPIIRLLACAVPAVPA